MAETRRLERPYGVNRDGLASRFLTYSEHISIKNKTRLRFRINNSLHKFAICAFKIKLAEREGFEPPDPCGSTVFKTAAINHSAISPKQKIQSCLTFIQRSYVAYQNKLHLFFKLIPSTLPAFWNRTIFRPCLRF